MTDRRRLIANAGLVALASLTGCATPSDLPGSGPFFAAHRLPLGVQLYAIAPDLEIDFDGTLSKLHAMGIRSVEMAGFHGRSAAQVRASFDRAGLSCTSAHIQALANGNGPSLDGDLDALARDMHAIGITQVVVPIPLLDHAPTSHDDFIRMIALLTSDDFRRTARFLNVTGASLLARGLSLSYHNHNFEFAPNGGGSNGFDILLRETDPAHVSFELDAGWVSAAGLDPVALLREHPGRFTQMHVKDIKPGTTSNFALDQDPVDVGYGGMEWRAILPAAYAAGVRRFYIEQEPPYTGPRMDSIAKSAAYLLNLRTA